MVRDCGITETYIIILDCPLLFESNNIMDKKKNMVHFEFYACTVQKLNLHSFIPESMRYIIELPLVNPKLTGVKSKLTFASINVIENEVRPHSYHRNGAIFKYCLQSSTTLGVIQWKGHAVSEACLIPRQDVIEEDDAYLSVIICVGASEEANATMYIFDARSMSSQPLAIVHAPAGTNIPNGVHSQFIASETLALLSAS